MGKSTIGREGGGDAGGFRIARGKGDQKKKLS